MMCQDEALLPLSDKHARFAAEYGLTASNVLCRDLLWCGFLYDHMRALREIVGETFEASKKSTFVGLQELVDVFQHPYIPADVAPAVQSAIDKIVTTLGELTPTAAAACREHFQRCVSHKLALLRQVFYLDGGVLAEKQRVQRVETARLEAEAAAAAEPPSA